MKGSLLFILICFFTLAATAKVKVAFIQSYDSSGRLIRLTENGRFFHTAIQVQGKWINSHPSDKGVAIISYQQLQLHGDITDIIEVHSNITLNDVAPYLGLPFDFWYTWGNDKIYCTELIAKLLNIKPEPMVLNKKFWPKNYWHLDGLPGLSPDRLFEILTQK